VHLRERTPVEFGQGGTMREELSHGNQYSE
jgi:hypothetical protein